EMPTQSQDLYNFFKLRQKPLVMIENNTFFVCYLDFLLDLFWSGTYYLIINSEDKIVEKERENFFNYLDGKTKEQTLAIIGDACACVVLHAEQTLKPLISEDLDFQKKKQSLKENSTPSHARTLSSFSYRSILIHLKSRAFGKQVELAQVNPAFTSLI